MFNTLNVRPGMLTGQGDLRWDCDTVDDDDDTVDGDDDNIDE